MSNIPGPWIHECNNETHVICATSLLYEQTNTLKDNPSTRKFTD